MDKPLFIDEEDRQRVLHLRELLKKNAPAVYAKYKSYKLLKSASAKDYKSAEGGTASTQAMETSREVNVQTKIE